MSFHIVRLCQGNKSPGKFQLISKPRANERIKLKEKRSKLSERHAHVKTMLISNIWGCLYNFPRPCLPETQREKTREQGFVGVRVSQHCWLVRTLSDPPSFEEGS